MTDIYDLHAKAFAQVSAYVIVKDGVRVATVSFKSPKDGAGRLWAYVHWLGTEMVRGCAGGGGYDKHSAALAQAARRAVAISADAASCLSFWQALGNDDDGRRWYIRLRHAGFDVWQAV